MSYHHPNPITSRSASPALTGMVCQGKPIGAFAIQSMGQHHASFRAFEFCVDSFAISNVSSTATFPEAGIMEHQWGDILYAKVLIIQVSSLTFFSSCTSFDSLRLQVEPDVGRKTIRLQLDQVQFEWSPSFLDTIMSMAPPRNNEVKEDNESVLLLIAKFSDVGIYMPIENNSKWILEHRVGRQRGQIHPSASDCRLRFSKRHLRF